MSILFKAGCFTLFMGIACTGLSSAYAEEKKALAVESAVFGGMSFYVVNPISAKNNPYDGILPDKNLVSVENIPADKFRVLKLPEQDSDWQDNLELVENACADFE